MKQCNFDLKYFAIFSKVFFRHNTTPPAEFTFDPELNVRHFGLEDYKNKTLVMIIQDQMNECSKDCVRDVCKDTISVTEVSVFPYNHKNGSFTVASMCSRSPAVMIEFEPTMGLSDFLIYISSCLGLWFGVSIRSMSYLFEVWTQPHLKKIRVGIVSPRHPVGNIAKNQE